MNMEQKEENGQTLTVFSAAEAGAAETTAAPEETPDPAIATANGLIEARFEQTKAAQLTQRAGAEIIQSGETHTLGNVASLVLRWNGTQPDGTAGSAVRALVLDRTTGEEIRLEQLFDDADAAIGAMERIIEDDAARIERLYGIQRAAADAARRIRRGRIRADGVLSRRQLSLF
ncbi:MAG: hypothetical protein ACLUI3_01985 [Christensenellales bacterium]